MALKLDDTPQSDYDDGKPAWQTNLQDDNLEDAYAAPSASDGDLPEGHPDRGDSNTPGELSAAEAAGGGIAKTSAAEKEESGALGSSDQLGEGYKHEKTSKFGQATARVKGLSKGKKYLLALGGGGAAVFLILIVILLSLLASLKIVHIAENLTVYNFERQARTFSQEASDITAETVATEGLDDAGTQSLVSRFGDGVLTPLKKFLANDPEKIIENLKAEGRLKFIIEDGPPRTILPGNRRILTGFEVDGTPVKLDLEAAADNSRWENLRFSATLETELDDALQGFRASVRSDVNKSLLKSLGIKLRFWDKTGDAYAGLSEEAAVKKAEADAFKKANAEADTNCQSAAICDAAEETVKDVETAVDDAVKDDSVTDAPGVENKAVDAAEKDIEAAAENDTLKNIVGATSLVYGVAVPVCLIYDGTITNAQSTIDNHSAALQRTFFAVRSAADQQKAGDTNLSAVGGFQDKLGNVDDANILRRARGDPVDTTKETSTLSQPQASASGTYTALDLIPGLGGNNLVKTILEQSCPIVTDIRVGAGLALLELALQAATGGSGAPAEEEAKGGITKFIEDNIFNKLADAAIEAGASSTSSYVVQRVRNSLGSFILKVGAQTSLILASSFYLKTLVVQHATATQDGLSTGETYVNQADMGANLYANDVNRKMYYGKPMTRPEVAMSNLADSSAIAKDNANQSTYQRYFALSNPHSLLTQFGSTVASMLHGSSGPVGSFLANLNLSGLFHAFSALLPLHNYALAATQASGAGDYNIVQWGWSQEELSLIHNNPDNYSPVINAAILDKSGKTSDIESDYGDCFTKTLGELTANQEIVRNDDGSLKDDEGKCSPNNLSINNSKYGDLVFRYRLSKMNDNVLAYLNGIQNPKDDSSTSQTSSGGTGFVWPVSKDVNNMGISQCFTWNGSSGHPGLDISNSGGIEGKPVLAAADGIVSFAGPNDGYGSNFVAITHANGFGTSYGHMDSMSVKVGDHVVQGQQIGTVGSQGESSGPHLHFNMYPGVYSGNDGPNVDPLKNGLSIPSYVANPNGCT